MKRSSYDAPKIGVGSFLLAPSFSEKLTGDDNIYASDLHLASDLIFTAAEDLDIQSQWLSDGAHLHLLHAHDVYADHPAENGNSYGVDAGFRFNVGADGLLDLEASFVQQPQSRNSAQADSQSLARPIYNTIPVSASYTQDLGRWHNDMKIEISRKAYISQADAVRSAIQSHFHDRLSYALTGDAWSFMQLSYSTQDWRVNPDLRNFYTLTTIAGINIQLAELVDFELGAGVQQQHYIFPGFQDLVAPTFSGHLNWNILPLTTLSASAEQAVSGLEAFCGRTNQTCSALPATASAALSNQRGALEVTSAEIGIQHEFWHDILGEVRFRFEQDRFDPVDLVDRNYSVNLGTRFLLNRNLEVDTSYVFNVRTANQTILLYNSGPYQADIVSLTLKAAM